MQSMETGDMEEQLWVLGEMTGWEIAFRLGFEGNREPWRVWRRGGAGSDMGI